MLTKIYSPVVEDPKEVAMLKTWRIKIRMTAIKVAERRKKLRRPFQQNLLGEGAKKTEKKNKC